MHEIFLCVAVPAYNTCVEGIIMRGAAEKQVPWHRWPEELR